ncbi:MAG: lipopolysaccharide heptosyltransferase, partial [Rhizobacter sp.]|nr:lipopolysaccharide heptosyltransferase [Rhizobacter sp.]
ALIAGAKGVVSNDSGLMHVAAAFGVPQVAVYGSTSPEHTPPLNTRAQVLWLKEELQLDCAPCFDRECRFGHTRCLTGVSAQRVEAALDEALVSSAASIVRLPAPHSLCARRLLFQRPSVWVRSKGALPCSRYTPM